MKKIFEKIVRYVSFVSILAFVGSCDKKEYEGWDSPYVCVESYIPYYVVPNSLMLNESWNYNFEPGFVLKIKGIDIVQNKDSDKDQYNALAKKYGDVGYNSKAPIGREGAISVAIDSISVVSDTDIDTLHSKGTELSDIVMLNTRSYYLFVKSGYKDTNDQYTDKDKFISEYTKEDLTLLFNRHGLGFHFDSAKVIKGTHNLTITIYFEDGKILSTTQTLKFE